MKLHVNIRAKDSRGEFTIQTRVDALHPLEALLRVMEDWNIKDTALVRIHVGVPEGEQGEKRA